MAFCGQCGLLLNSNVAKCPRCGTVSEINVVSPEAPIGGNDATIAARGENATQVKETFHTPPPQAGYPQQNVGNYPSDAGTQAAYPPPGNYPGQGAPSSGVQSGGNYPSYNTPVYPSQPGGYYGPPGTSQPGIYPSTNPGYPSQAPIPPRKRRVWPFILALLLVLLLGAGASAFLILGPSHLPWLAGQQNSVTPTAPTAPAAPTTVPTAQPSPTAQPQNTPTAQPAPTAQPSPTTQPTPVSTQPAQAAIQQYYAAINNKDYQSAYNLWVSYPDTYAHYKQGFAHTRRDDITLGDSTVQSDGSVQVNITIQSTEDATTGTGTQVTTYQGYYSLAQQSDGTWKIVTANINKA